MALAALVFAPIGAFSSQYVPVNTLLILFAFAVLGAAIRMVFFAKKPGTGKNDGY